MIIVKIGDGMGNQLFNYACGYAAARRENDTLKLDTSEADNSTLRDFELDKFHLKYDARESFPNRTVFQKIYPAGFPAGLSLSKKPRRVWRRKPTNKIKSFSVGACT